MQIQSQNKGSGSGNGGKVGSSGPVGSSNNILGGALTWDSSSFGTGIVLSEGNTHVFLKEQAYVFRTVVANYGFSSGINYWEIVADPRT
jgi:E3 ubiquitin-protein ligase NRDP1